MCKPLKGKVQDMEDVLHEWDCYHDVFIVDDVKSAVKGLIQELQNDIALAEEYECETDIDCGIEKIKHWLADAVELWVP